MKDEAKLLHISCFSALMKQWNNNGTNYKRPTAVHREQHCDKWTSIRNLVATMQEILWPLYNADLSCTS